MTSTTESLAEALRLADSVAACSSKHNVRAFQVAAGQLVYLHGPALLAALRLREWRPIETAPVSTPLEKEYFLAYCPDDEWGPLGAVHVACRYQGFAADTVRPVGTNGERRALAWKPCAPPTADDLARTLEESATGDESASA